MNGTELREHLEELGLQQAQFAELAGVNVRTVQRWYVKGVPPLAIAHVLQVMEAYRLAKATSRG